MNKFNKTIIYAIVISLLSGFFVSVQAKTTINNQSELETLLTALDITLSKDTDTNKEVTRSEAAYLVSKFMNFEKTDFDATAEIFADVNSETDYAGSVEWLYRAGILSGNGNAMYRPDDIITYSEIIIMMVRAMGYKDAMAGAEMADYVKKASDIGFTRGIRGLKLDTGITYGVLKTIIYNALKCKILKIDSFADSKVEYKLGDTALNEYFDIWSAEGVVTETEVTAIMGETTVSTGEVMIGGEIYQADYKLVAEFLGQYIKFYYKLDDKYKDKTFLYVYDTKSTSVVFNSDDIDDYSEGIYTVCRGDLQKKYKLDKNADVIYNGRFISDYGDSTLFVPDVGNVKLVDTMDDGRYDLIVINSYIIMSVEKVDDDGIIYDRTNYNNRLDTDTEYLTVTDESGYASSVSLIKRGDVIFAAQSIDRKVTDIKVSKNIVSGKVENILSEYGDDYFVINGDKYYISDYFYKTNDYLQSNKFMSYRDTVQSFHLDPDGKIATYINEATATEIEPGYLLKAYIDLSGNEDEVWLKILTKDNVKKSFQVKSNAKVDGRKIGKKAEEMLSCFANEVFEDGTCITRRSVITYKLNSENKITEVDYPYFGLPEPGESADSFHRYGTYMNNGLQQRNGVLSGRIVLGSPTWVFSVPNNEQTASDEEFEAFSYNFEYDKWVKFDAYSYRKPAVIMDVMVTHESKQEAMKDGGGYQLVTDINQCLDEDEKPVEEITIMEGSDIYKYFVADDLDISKIDKGDIIRFALNNEGRISSVAKYYDCSEDKVENNHYSYMCDIWAMNADYATFVGGIYDINNGIARMFFGDTVPTADTVFLMNKVNGFKKVVFNTKTRKAEVVNDLNSVTTYESGRSNYTRVAVSFRYGAPKYMYIYETK